MTTAQDGGKVVSLTT